MVPIKLWTLFSHCERNLHINFEFAIRFRDYFSDRGQCIGSSIDSPPLMNVRIGVLVQQNSQFQMLFHTAILDVLKHSDKMLTRKVCS